MHTQTTGINAGTGEYVVLLPHHPEACHSPSKLYETGENPFVFPHVATTGGGQTVETVVGSVLLRRDRRAVKGGEWEEANGRGRTVEANDRGRTVISRSMLEQRRRSGYKQHPPKEV